MNKAHKTMIYDEIIIFFSKFFGELPILTLFIGNKLLNKMYRLVLVRN